MQNATGYICKWLRSVVFRAVGTSLNHFVWDVCLLPAKNGLDVWKEESKLLQKPFLNPQGADFIHDDELNMTEFLKWRN